MKVFHLHFGTDGGAERFLVTLANAFARRGIEQKFVIRPNRSWKVDLEPLGSIIEDHGRKLSPKTMLLRWRMERICRAWNPDAIMLWMPRAARIAPAWGGALKVSRMGDFPRHLRYFGRCDVLVGNVPAIEKRILDLGWSKPVLTIPNFARSVPVEPIKRAAMNTPDDAFVVAGSGRFVKLKGFGLLVRAAARIPDAFLWLIGDGEERKQLERLAEQEGIASRTRFAGWIDEPVHYLASADVAVMPSRHEPFGNALIEAWRAGVPSISTRTAGPSWYARHETDCLLIDIDDLDAAVEAVERLRGNPGLCERLVKGAKERLDTMLSEEAAVDAWMKLFMGAS